jgi:predicted ribosomally synthesized peptide with SipW-like signal peptide
MKRLLYLILALLVAAGMAGAGTWAYFQDTEASTGNNFAAGTLDLKVGGQDDPNVPVTFNLSNLKPGDSSSATVNLSNAGSISGALTMKIQNVVNSPGSTPEPEPPPDSGLLGDKIILTVMNATGNPLAYGTLNSLQNLFINLASLPAGGSTAIQVKYEVPAAAGNDIQGDSVSFDILFSLEQAQEVYNLPAQYGGTQGGNNWYYYYHTGSYGQLVYRDYVNPWGYDGRNSWATDASRYLQIDRNFIQTGEGANTAVGWRAPHAGTVSIIGTMTIGGNWQGGWRDDGIDFKIMKNGTTVAGPVWVYHLTGYNTKTLTATVNVAGGDMIYFYQNRKNWQDCDLAGYSFTVYYK